MAGSFLDNLLAKIPGVTSAQTQIDTLRRQFLAIPSATAQARTSLMRIRQLTNDANERQSVDGLLAKADAVDAGFQSVTAQFSAFDTLRRSGASAGDTAAAAVGLAASASSVIRQSNALTAAVAPLASKYGQALNVPIATGSGMGAGLGILGIAGVVMVMLLRPKRARRNPPRRIRRRRRRR